MLIFNAKALLPTGFRERIAIRSQGGMIAEISESLAPNPGEQAIDAQGMWLLPGFIDIHIHGYGGRDTMNGLDAIRSMASGLVRHGVTGFLPTTMAAAPGDTREALAAAHALMLGVPAGARVLGCHLEGPFLNVAKKGAQPAQFIFAPSTENYLEIARDHEQAVKLITIAPEVEGAMDLISELSGTVAVSAGHTDASIDQMARAAEAGVTQVTHLFNGMNALNHRAPGVPGAALTIDSIRVQIIADLLHLHPAVLKLAWRAKGADGCLLITDAMEATGMADGEYSLGANRVFVRNREARLSDGTIAGSTLTMDRAVKNMVQAVGVPLEQAVHMASAAPAAAIGEAKRGRLEIGCCADMLLMDAAYEVVATFVDGTTAYQR